MASQIGHWGEIIQGPVRDAVGHIVVGLVTLPCHRIRAIATAEVGTSGRSSFSSGKSRAFRAARTFLDREGLSECSLQLSITSSIPCGVGAGSSTADTIAAIHATATAIGIKCSDHDVQRLCWEIEGASDPLALMSDPRTPFYASRRGIVLEWIERPLPEMICLGFNASPGERRITADIVAGERFRSCDIDQFAEVVDLLKRGILNEAIELVGLAATRSAELRQRQFPLPRFESLAAACLDAGAVGMSISHSGVVAAALFAPNSPDLQSRLSNLTEALRQAGAGDISPFAVGASQNVNAGFKI